MNMPKPGPSVDGYNRELSAQGPVLLVVEMLAGIVGYLTGGFWRVFLGPGERFVKCVYRCGHVWFHRMQCSYMEKRRQERLSKAFDCPACARMGALARQGRCW